MMSTTLDTQEKNVEARGHRESATERSMLDGLECEMTVTFSPEVFAALEQLAVDTEQELGVVLVQAIALYKVVVDSKRQGKHVGVADQEDKLDVEFVGLGSPDSGL
jgi:predicted transcriptional regulator